MPIVWDQGETAGLSEKMWTASSRIMGTALSSLPIKVNRKNRYNSPSPGGRESEGGGFHPHPDPLPSRKREFIRDCVEDYK